jgi:hypothetical protein
LSATYRNASSISWRVFLSLPDFVEDFQRVCREAGNKVVDDRPAVGTDQTDAMPSRRLP